MKYKIGEKVRIIDDGNTENWWADARELIGEVFTIKEITEEDGKLLYWMEEDAFIDFWREDDFELVEKTLRDLEVGDYVVDEDGDKAKVLDVLPNSVLLSEFGEGLEDVALGLHTFKEMEEDGYEVYVEPVPNYEYMRDTSDRDDSIEHQILKPFWVPYSSETGKGARQYRPEWESKFDHTEYGSMYVEWLEREGYIERI